MEGLKQYRPAFCKVSMIAREVELKTLLPPFDIEIACWVLAIDAFPVQTLKCSYSVNCIGIASFHFVIDQSPVSPQDCPNGGR